MQTRFAFWVQPTLFLLVLGLALHPSAAAAQSRTPWQMHFGKEIVGFDAAAAAPEAEGVFQRAAVPAVGDRWAAAPDPRTIGFARVFTARNTARGRQAVRFIFFQTEVRLPAQVTSFRVLVRGVGPADVARLSFYGSRCQDGQDGIEVARFHGADLPGNAPAAKPGRDADPPQKPRPHMIGSAGAADLTPLVEAGEVCRVVFTLAAFGSAAKLAYAQVEINGNLVAINGKPVPVRQPEVPVRVPLPVVAVVNPAGAQQAQLLALQLRAAQLQALQARVAQVRAVHLQGVLRLHATQIQIAQLRLLQMQQAMLARQVQVPAPVSSGPTQTTTTYYYRVIRIR